MKNKVKIVYLAPKFPYPPSSGEEHSLSQHIEELSKNKFNYN